MPDISPAYSALHILTSVSGQVTMYPRFRTSAATYLYYTLPSDAGNRLGLLEGPEVKLSSSKQRDCGVEEIMKQQYNVTAVLDQFENDHLYIESHRGEWLKQFPNNWVSVS